MNDATRSLPLRHLAPLADRSGGSLISLQKGGAEQQLDAVAFGARIVRLGTFLHDMADTAAAIREMDLVISVCTAVAHLAATLNTPTWLMLAYASEWRWLLERTDTPWYPTMRIFRQDSRGDWPGVVNKIVAPLEREGAA